MLHILLLILKILGIIVLAAIALILVLAAVLILSPFRYHIRASADGSFDSICGKAEFSWLFRLICCETSYKDGEFVWQGRAAWKRFSSGTDPGGAGPAPEKRKSRTETGHTEKKEEKEKARETERSGPQKTVQAPSGKQRVPAEKREPAESAGRGKEKSFFERMKERILAGIEKMKYTFRQFCGKIKALTRKKERLRRFIDNEVHRKAFSRVIREVRRLLSFLRPKHLEAEVVFGLEDPAETGYLLAVISMIYPLIGEYTVIRPDFEHKVLKGNIEADGKIRILYGLIPAWNLVRDKNVRTTYRHIKKFRL